MKRGRGRPPEKESHERKKQLAIQLLATGHSRNSTARQLEVSPATVDAWKADPAFSAAVDEESAELGQETRARFMALQLKAVDCLQRAMREGGGPGVRASIEILKVSGITNMAVIPPRLAELFKDKVLDIMFVDPAALPQRSSPPAAGGSGDDAANPPS